MQHSPRRSSTGTVKPTCDATQEKSSVHARGSKKRFRKSFSCGNCRQSKIKCDRVFPCRQCTIRRIGDSCGLHQLQDKEASKPSKNWAHTSMSTESLQSEGMMSPPSRHSSEESCWSQTSSVSLGRDDLHKTIETFRQQISNIEYQIKKAKLSSSRIQRRHHRSISRRDHYQPLVVEEVNLETVLSRIATLETKLDMLLKRLAHIIPPPSSSMQVQPVTSIVANKDSDTLDPSEDNLQLKLNIDQWFEEDVLLRGENQGPSSSFCPSVQSFSAPLPARDMQVMEYFAFDCT